MVKEEDIFDPCDILQHISGVNSFKYNYTLESWIWSALQSKSFLQSFFLIFHPIQQEM